MPELWLPMSDVPAQGREFSFSDPGFWAEAFDDFGLNLRMGDAPIEATLFALPQDEGVLVRGRVRGTVSVPCVRCAEEFELAVDQEFDDFEPADAEPGEPVRVRTVKGVVELDAGSIIWEQFVLALPESTVCREECKGLCPGCGHNLNQGECDCGRDETDPRLAILRGLKIR